MSNISRLSHPLYNTMCNGRTALIVSLNTSVGAGSCHQLLKEKKHQLSGCSSYCKINPPHSHWKYHPPDPSSLKSQLEVSP